MKKKLFFCTLLAAVAASAEIPAVTALKKGDFPEARRLFAEEIEKRPDDANLKKGYAALKTMMRRRELFDAEENPELLQKLGKVLRTYYYHWGLFGEAEAVDAKVHAKAPSPANAAAYAVTLLNLGKNREAAAVFEKLDLAAAKPGVRLCAALAYARTGNTDKAAALCAKHPVKEASVNELALHARIAAVRGDAPAAAEAVRLILEKSPEKHHPQLKEKLFTAADFARVAAAPEFKQALETASKVKDECAGCPNRGTAKCDHANDPNHKCEHAGDPNHKCEGHGRESAKK